MQSNDEYGYEDRYTYHHKYQDMTNINIQTYIQIIINIHTNTKYKHKYKNKCEKSVETIWRLMCGQYRDNYEGKYNRMSTKTIKTNTTEWIW